MAFILELLIGMEDFPVFLNFLLDLGQQFELCQNISAVGHSDIPDWGRGGGWMAEIGFQKSLPVDSDAH